MPSEILMPALSPTMEEGKLVKWLVREGDSVRAGDVIAEIETDKATMEVEAAEDGKLGKILVAEGSEHVPVNRPIALLFVDGEDVPPSPQGAEGFPPRTGEAGAHGGKGEGAQAIEAISPSPQPSPQRGEGVAPRARREPARCRAGAGGSASRAGRAAA